MGTQVEDFLSEIAENFDIPPVLSVGEMGNGRINDTYLVLTSREKFTLQKINTAVFKNVEVLMENIRSVSEHISEKHRTISPVKTKEGGYYFEKNGEFYRVFNYLEGDVIETVENADEMYICGLGFGGFQRDLLDFRRVLKETVPGFHNTVKRTENFIKAMKEDKKGRFERAKKLCARYLEFASVTKAIIPGPGWEIPVRTAHNDTKINNIVLEKKKKPIGIIDLDTVMPGSLLYDFGDAVRSACLSAEETDAENAKLNIAYLGAFSEGFGSLISDFITDGEKALLFESCKTMTYECGVRFLTDYLSGDVYFKTNREEQNLDRAKAHAALLDDMIDNEAVAEKTVKEIFRRYF